MRHKLDPLRQPRPITKVGADIPASRMGGTPAGFTHFIRRIVER